MVALSMRSVARVAARSAVGWLVAAAGLWCPPALAQEGNALLLGVSTPLSGPQASAGQALVAGVRLGLGPVLAAGLDGRPVQLLVQDDAGQPQRTVANTQALLRQGVIAVTAYLGTQGSEAALPLLAAAGVPMVGVASSADSLRQPNQAQVFNLRAGAADEIAALVQQFDTIGLRRIALVAQADALGNAGLEGLQVELARIAIRPEAMIRLPNGGDEAQAAQAVKQLCQVAPEGVLLAVSPASAQQLLHQVHLQACLRASLAALSETGSTLVGRPEAARLTLAQVLPHPRRTSHPLVAAYHRDKAQAQDKTPPSPGELEGYLYGRVLADLLRQCGRRSSPRCLQDTLNTRPPELPGWKLRFTPDDRRGSRFVELVLLNADGQPRY